MKYRILPVIMCWSSLAAADGLAVKQLDATKPLPAGIKAKGAAVREVWSWTAGKTPGYLVLSATSRSQKGLSRQLYGQVWVGSKPRELRLITDGVERCQLDLVANFLAGSASIRDEDADGTPEIAFAYDIGCGATADPVPRKLIVIEGDAKHALRGKGLGKDPDDKVIGGEVKVDPFTGQLKLKAWAEARWKALLATEPTPFEP